MVEVVVDSADKETTFKSVSVEHEVIKNRTNNVIKGFFIIFCILVKACLTGG